jgi:hypothetical protein
MSAPMKALAASLAQVLGLPVPVVVAALAAAHALQARKARRGGK